MEVGVDASYNPRQPVRLNAFAGEALRVGALIGWA
jgi:hypothetical protein